jgi:rhomboid family GlyGly-CTERM serine protease
MAMVTGEALDDRELGAADRRFPFAGLVEFVERCWVTLLLAAVVVGLTVVPSAAGVMQFEREGVAAGEVWRIVSGHLVHWNLEHFVWDLAAFALLGAICEARDRRTCVATLSAAAVAISVGVFWLRPDLATYRGLSGIDSALFVLAACSYGSEARATGDRWGTLAACGAAVAFLLKVGFEWTTGMTIFVDSAAAGFEPMPLAHVMGGVAAGAVWGVSRLSAGRGDRRR